MFSAGPDYLGYMPGSKLEIRIGCMVVRGRFLSFLLCLALLSCAAAQAKQFAVITEKTNSTNDLSSADLVKLFNAHTHSWPDGTPVTIVMRDPSSGDMELVLHRVLDMTAAQARDFMATHRAGVVVAGSDDAVLHFVSTTRGAIGIIDLYSLTDGVKVVKVDGKLPVQPGYLLRGN